MAETANDIGPAAPAAEPSRLRSLLRRVHPGTWPVLLGAAGVAGAVMVHFIDPNEPGNYPTCPWLLLTGTWCPGCGTMRTVHALTQLDLMGALQMNVFLIVMLPYIAFNYGTWLYRAFRPAQGPPRPRSRARLLWSNTWLIALLVGFIAYWVLRNTPWGIFLAPGGVPGSSPLYG